MVGSRLFVPLATGPFEDFRFNGKKAEVRGYGRVYTERHVFEGRPVELRKGYSLREGMPEEEWRLWGEVGTVAVGSMGNVFSEFDFKDIFPRAESLHEAEEALANIIGERPKYIVFVVKL